MDFTEAPVVATAAAALRGDVKVFAAADSNLVTRRAVPEGAEPDLGRWPVRVAVEIAEQRIAPVPIEPISFVAQPGEEGTLTVWCGHQAPHRLKRQLGMLLGIGAGKVRVLS